jgi:hypothetical protein
MQKNKSDEPIKVIVTNAPTKEEAENRLKALAVHLGSVWK